uniref:Exoribonuclease phosphorolytic domain-containing protein n=1 Tax=Chromera velia CCMP2878 TaxID=1169474 RepID=A0A0G4HDZ5_9ALVE|mmetsp:Transcript_32857/g.65063  ORF Transcript_32857/g.65063 Transcript_32857/m.65063 type:complete len:335 (+) Transcript_32857:106-1110(+)|eukprot:Cvel_26543.t1-p1 / transcript=Cvel_26543.t1 / gene=Cvel_26543 / organism=Chromera_velia_CCMP2878 / gene_product=Probable exosome complex exonuclease 1, putative / transcript_product=Probable exosome complex exonuclease 1, putative / location=Cvel_scaffold3175:8259-13699(-) / protein_length=334 / sequence_SO=supercontig / SO=protein_coding / is_pseudo=false
MTSTASTAGGATLLVPEDPVGPSASSSVPAPSLSSRADGRKVEQMRPLCMRVRALRTSRGSAYVSFGGERERKTQVVATVNGPRQALGRAAQAASASRGVLEVQCSIAPFISDFPAMETSEHHKKRDAIRNQANALSGELRECFSSVVLLDNFPRTVIDCKVLVLEDDGSVLPAAVVALSLALADAQISMRDLVAAVCVYAVEEEQSREPKGKPELAVDLTTNELRCFGRGPKGKSSLSELCLGLCPLRHGVALLRASGTHLSADISSNMVLLAEQACAEIGAGMRRCLVEACEVRAAARSGSGQEEDDLAPVGGGRAFGSAGDESMGVDAVAR